MTQPGIDRIDELIHGRVRLGVMACLSGVESADFTELRTRLGLTDGNLSVHLRKLEEAGYIASSKGFVDRRPQTRLRLTARGRKAYIAYLDALSELVGAPLQKDATRAKTQ